MQSPLDPYIPKPDIRERFSVTVRAPAEFVYRVACEFDMQSPWIVRTIFWWRARFGIIPIRWILLPAIRRAAEREWRIQKTQTLS